ncbi:MAG: hypothetical protein V9E88_02365 [Ferruginibacter sp.]
MNNAIASHDLIKEDKPGIAARIFGNFFSYLFHPVFVPLYIIFFLLYIHPSAFSGFSDQEKKQTVLIILLNLVIFPLITVLLLKAVGFIDSLYLRTQKDRIIPYIASGIFFFWGYTVFKEQPQYPPVLTAFILGIFLASSAALLANIYFKVSMHAIGMGGWLGFFLLLFYRNSMLMTWPLCLALLVTGLVCSSRLLLRSHEQKDIYGGLLIGMITQWVAAVVVL